MKKKPMFILDLRTTPQFVVVGVSFVTWSERHSLLPDRAILRLPATNCQ